MGVETRSSIFDLLMNLCTNAAQAINEKDGVLEISLGNVELDQKTAADRPNLAFLKHPRQFGLHGIKPAKGCRIQQGGFRRYSTSFDVGLARNRNN